MGPSRKLSCSSGRKRIGSGIKNSWDCAMDKDPREGCYEKPRRVTNHLSTRITSTVCVKHFRGRRNYGATRERMQTLRVPRFSPLQDALRRCEESSDV